MLEQLKQHHDLINQRDYPLQHLCMMTLSNLRECQLFPTFHGKLVEQHDGGAGRILLEKTLSQNKSNAVDFMLTKHFIANIGKTGP